MKLPRLPQRAAEVLPPPDPALPDNEVELRALCSMLTMPPGFRLAFARANHPTLRDWIISEARRRCPRLEVTTVTLDPAEPAGIVGQMEAASGEQSPGAMFVLGIERMFDLHAGRSPEIDVLNLNRDYLATRFAWPVVFLLPDFGLRELIPHAPDLWSWRSGTYAFAGEVTHAEATVTEASRDGVWELAPRERVERAEVLRHVLGELDPDDPTHREAIARAHERLGQLAAAASDHAAAEHHFASALPIYRQIGDRLGEASVLYGAGQLALAIGQPAVARQRLLAAEEIYRAIGLAEWAVRAHGLAQQAEELLVPPGAAPYER